MGVDLEGAEPLYRQVAAEVERRIAEGVYPAGKRIPSTAELSEEFGVSRRTITDAFVLLKDRGVVRGVQGRGTFARAADG
ncbi:winged helix-turn-helix domain-containing protein [Actinomadura sp. WMMB 499]|uniref:winged helix-turn-helix domain-containing protein n=1 Tax=Actinomadura sp. WMMB 499 TaxID=1219491 RepID=UPI001247CE1F|nr:winged helix-turn-helix domain-containing protein [Actinomadura sp. WMMB 499]QFG22395.1 winged helix-turn-helix transcriptional regulator [Actinomadura sp. WMMB 499]